jgi:hypothetical protein
MNELWIIPICIVLLGIIAAVLLKMIDNMKIEGEDTTVGSEFVKWAEIYICHERKSATGTPACGDYEEKWWIEEKRVNKGPKWNY